MWASFDRLLEDLAVGRLVRRQRNASIKEGVDRWGNKTVLISFEAVSFLSRPASASTNVRVQLAVGQESGMDAGIATVNRKEDLGEDAY